MEITKANAKDYPNVKKLYKKVLNDPNNNIVRVFGMVLTLFVS